MKCTAFRNGTESCYKTDKGENYQYLVFKKLKRKYQKLFKVNLHITVSMVNKVLTEIEMKHFALSFYV